MTDEQAKCELCGEPMPAGETMFKFHGYSGPCPKPPLPRKETIAIGGVWLRSNLNKAQMLVEVDGEWRLVAEEPLEAPFGHVVEPGGIANSPRDPLSHGGGA